MLKQEKQQIPFFKFFDPTDKNKLLSDAIKLLLSVFSSFWLYGRILKTNLSWTWKKSNSSDVENFSSVFITFLFALKGRVQCFSMQVEMNKCFLLNP